MNKELLVQAIAEAKHENITSIEPIYKNMYWVNKVKVLNEEERKAWCKFLQAFLGTAAIQEVKATVDGGVTIEYKELVKI